MYTKPEHLLNHNTYTRNPLSLYIRNISLLFRVTTDCFKNFSSTVILDKQKKNTTNN